LPTALLWDTSVTWNRLKKWPACLLLGVASPTDRSDRTQDAESARRRRRPSDRSRVRVSLGRQRRASDAQGVHHHKLLPSSSSRLGVVSVQQPDSPCLALPCLVQSAQISKLAKVTTNKGTASEQACCAVPTEGLYVYDEACSGQLRVGVNTTPYGRDRSNHRLKLACAPAEIKGTVSNRMHWSMSFTDDTTAQE
jgi:hypothetical protein